MRKRHIRVLKFITVVKCENLPPSNSLPGLEIQSRHVRLCLFDGKQVVSNVHQIGAQFNQRNPRTWRFSAKVFGRYYLAPGKCTCRHSHFQLAEGQSCAEHAEVFVRSNYAKRSVVLLVEVGLSYLHTVCSFSYQAQLLYTTLKLITHWLLLQLKQPMGYWQQPMGNCRSCQWVAICAQAANG